MINLKGSGVALVTPFDENDNINYAKVKELIDYHIANKTDFIVVCGTTGESATLSLDEKKELLRFCVKYAQNKIPIICGTGTNNTKTTIELSKYAKEINAQGILVVTPYYNKCNNDGLYRHYNELSEEVYPLPIILYNVPSRTGVDMTVDTIYNLSKIENIIGIKEASTSLSKIANIILKTKNEEFNVFSGNDNLVLPTLSLGGVGVISVAANIVPREMHEICMNTNNSKDLYYKYLPLIDALFLDVNPIMIKHAMNYLNFNVGKVRMPLCCTKATNNHFLEKIIDETL